MATKRPIVWNPSLRIYEQLQSTDSLDVGDIALSLSYVDSPVNNTSIDLGSYTVVFVGQNQSNVLMLDPINDAVVMGNSVDQVSGRCKKRSFFKTVATTSANPVSVVYRRTTRCLHLTGKCFVYSTTDGKDNVFNIDAYIIGDPTNYAVMGPSEAVEAILQQTPDIGITISVVSDIVTINAIGHPTLPLQWSFSFDTTEIDQQ